MDKNTVMREGLLLNSTPPTEATAPLGVDEVWVKTLFTRVMEYVAQEKEGLQDAEEVSAAIQEAIKGIPYPSNEIVTIDHDFGYLSKSDLVTGVTIGTNIIFTEYSAEYYLTGIEFGKAKKFDITGKIDGTNQPTVNQYYRGGFFLPEGGTYFVQKTSGAFGFYSGKSLVFDIYVNAPGTSVSATSTSLYIARIA